MTTVTIGDETIDVEDPCALVGPLRAAYLRMIAGETEVEFRYGSKSVRLGVLATNMSELRSTIASLEAQCMAKHGQRRRFAKGVAWGG